jgi:hypothetical protein
MKSLLLAAMLTLMASGAQAITVNELKRADNNNQTSYTLGLIDGLLVMGAKCGLGSKTTYDQTVAIFNKYLANNPEEWSDEANVVFLNAIIKAYNCSATPNESSRSKTEVKW